MALLPYFRSLLVRWFAGPRRTPRRPRLALLFLEGREVPAAGGGFTGGGLFGEYYANAHLAGTPAFVRRDVRIDFDWRAQSPGGSTSPSYRQVGADGFSVRWTGQIVPKHNETYTFRATSDDGFRLWIRPANSGDWRLIIDNWTPHGATDDYASYAMRAGQAYDIRVEYYEAGGHATAKLRWSSPSTTEEVIDPAVSLGVNAVTYDYHVYADTAKTGRPEWGDVNDYFGRPNAPIDGTGSPLTDAGHIFWEGQDPAKTAGVYLLKFAGRAEVTSWFGRGQFLVHGTNYGSTLPAGVGYDAGSNTTTAQVAVANSDLFALNFRRTQRSAGHPENSGVGGVQLLRPINPGSGTSYQPGEMFDAHLKNAFGRFTTLRYLTANFNAEQHWGDRKLPGSMKGAWGDRAAVWENEVMLANETGKDLYITIPINASDDYVRKLSLVLKYGSDGVNPYTGPVDNPVYPGLNPNLRVYVEWANEVWNWAFDHAAIGANAAREAVVNRTPEGLVVNYDGRAPQGDFRRWAALKTVKASNTFRSIWGDGAMGDKVRVVLEYQYDNVQDTAVEALKFIDNFFNNADGQHVPNPRPVSYYIWGAGGASYFGATNPLGITEDIGVPNGGFEDPGAAPGTARSGSAGPWVVTGDAGVYRTLNGFGHNMRVAVDGVGAVPTGPQGAQALYLSGGATAAVNIDFPRAGVYAIAFKAAAEFGGDMGNPLDFYFDDQRVTPHAQDLRPNPNHWRPGTGFGRDPNAFTDYGTVPVWVPGPGRHTFRIVGRGQGHQTTVIDDVRVASTDAIFSSRIPGGGQAAGQVSRSDYLGQLRAQAQYALAYGLKVVAYEGGWSLGGDHQSVPIQSWAKYRDGRATDVMAAAIDTFNKAGGELNVLGTYDQWYLDDAANANNYPLVRGIDSRILALPSPTASNPPPAPAPTPAPTPSAPPSQPSALPGGWANDAIGSPDIAGSAQFDGGRWTVRGAGQNIWGSADEFQFAHTATNGDGVFTARVDSMDRTHGWAKAGVMVRAGTGESAQFAGVFRTPDNGVIFESRSANRATPQSVAVPVGDGPVWVRLVRRANSFAAYYSTDGDRWTRIGTAETISMPTNVRVGLAVTSHDPRQLATATFSNVNLSR